MKMQGKIFLSLIVGVIMGGVTLAVGLVLATDIALALGLLVLALSAMAMHVILSIVEARVNRQYAKIERLFKSPILYRTVANFNLGNGVVNGRVYVCKTGIVFASIDQTPYAVQQIPADMLARYEQEEINLRLYTNYGKIYTLFWDIPPKMQDKSMNEYVRSLQPDIYINNRGFDEGDFATPEREYEKNGEKGPFAKMTEKCNAIDTQSWGYRRDSDFYSYRYLLSDIDKIMARGGSYLLNIGPKADGTLDPVHVERIKRIGDWYNKMDGCLKEHEPDPVTYSIRQDRPWDEWIATRKNAKTYLHCYDGINSTAITMGRFPGMPKAVRLMNTGEELPFRVQRLPNYFDGMTCRAEQAYLRIYNIPVDELAQEPIVLEIQWND